MKVFLNVGKHPIYSELIDFPPNNVEYITPIEKEEKPQHYGALNNFKRKALMLAASTLRLPRLNYIKNDAELIHTSRGILPLNKQPWVIDVEHVASFVSFNHDQLNSAITKSTIQRFLASKYCKAILAHSEFSKKSIENALNCGKFKDKIKVMHLAVRPCEYEIVKSQAFNISFHGHHFLEKGGLEVLQAYDQLKKKYAIKLTIKTDDLPKELVDRYQEVNWIIKQRLSREQLFKELYCNQDLFVLPSYIDTFGFVVLEAMSAGLPVVTTNTGAFPELVEEGKTGFLIDSNLSCWNSQGLYARDKDFKAKLQQNKPQIVSQLVEKVSLLIENPKLHKEMSINAKKEVENGKFSIKQRNTQLKRIYEEALK